MKMMTMMTMKMKNLVSVDLCMITRLKIVDGKIQPIDKNRIR